MRNEDIMRAIGNLEGKIDSIIKDIPELRHICETNRSYLEDRASSLGSRLNTVEKKQYTIIAIATIVFTIMMGYIKKFFS